MIRNIKRTYFEVWGTEEAQNAFLKGLLCTICTLFVIQSIALIIVSLRKPTLVAVGKSESRVLTITPPSDELLQEELRRIVRKYVETHYSWDSTTIDKAHEQASKYVSEKLIKAFNSANADQIKIAKEKKVSQKVYVYDVAVDAKALSARVSSDRILIVEGLRATNPFILDITFDSGPRTDINPEGIYITGEKVVTQNGG